MNIPLPIFRNIKRRWRAKGHGVHSPFAYRFITEILALDSIYGYYEYDNIATRDIDAKTSRWLRLICRLKARYADRLIIVDDDFNMAGNVDPEEFTDKIIAIKDSNSGGGRKILKNVANRKFGMVFGYRRIAVVCLLKHLPCQNFEIHIPN